MKLMLTPQSRFDTLSVSVAGEVLTVNGLALDFTPLTEGSTLPRAAIDCPWIAGDVQRIGGVLHVPLLLPIAADATESARYPVPITVTQDGVVNLPSSRYVAPELSTEEAP